MRDVEPRLRLALGAALGQDRGRDATAEALAYGWEHRDKLRSMDNPAGYLYRVGRSKGRSRRKRAVLAPVDPTSLPEVEPGLPRALGRLSERQRIAVVLVHAYEYRRSEVAEMIGISTSALDTHLSRGLEKLRVALGVDVNA